MDIGNWLIFIRKPEMIGVEILWSYTGRLLYFRPVVNQNYILLKTKE